MLDNIPEFARKVCDYTIEPQEKKISGTYEVGFQNYKLFEIKGDKAKELHKEIVKIEDGGN